MKTSFSRLEWFDNVETRQHPWPGLNWLTAQLIVKNVKEAVTIYEIVFGIVPIFELPDEQGNILFARMRYRGSNFTLTQEGAFNSRLKSPTTNNPPCFAFYLYVDDVDQTFGLALSHGFQIVDDPREEFWGDKRAQVVDPFGYCWDIAQRIK